MYGVNNSPWCGTSTTQEGEMKRQIRAGHRAVRGYFPSIKNNRQVAFESTFERDLFYLLELSQNVISYEEQPLKVEIVWGESTWKYTPDVLVTMTNRDIPTIYEVKPSTSDFPENKKKAMDRWCSNNNFTFEVIDASKIRTPELTRAKFLYPYLRSEPSQHIIDVICKHISQVGKVAIGDVLKSLQCDLSDIYFLIATDLLKCSVGIPSNRIMSMEVSGVK